MNNQTYDNENVLGGHKRFFLSNLPKPDTVIDLNAGQEWRLRGKRRHPTLFCLHGSVWVTQECDIRDYVLEKGDAFVVTLPGLVMVRAFSQARIGYAESLVALPFKGRFSQTVFKERVPQEFYSDLFRATLTGKGVGDVVTWQAPSRLRRFEVQFYDQTDSLLW